MIGHLDERIPEDAEHLHELLGEISDKLAEMFELLESDRLRGLKIKREEEYLLRRLETDAKHRNWRAVKEDIEKETEDEKEEVRLGEDELRELHSHFIGLMKIIKRKKLLSAIEEDLKQQKDKASMRTK